MARTRSEYRVRLDGFAGCVDPRVRPVTSADRQACAGLLLDAYRGTIDDEGENEDDALDAIDDYFERILWEHSFVAADIAPVAMAFAVEIDGVHYIDPVATAAAHKRHGLGRAVVRHALTSLAAAGVTEVGAAITDGNTGSERLFAGLGFERHGPYPAS